MGELFVPQTVPSGDGFKMPGEFEKHVRTWMAWPHRNDVWRENATCAQRRIAEFAALLSTFETVTMIVPRHQTRNAVCLLKDTVRIVFADTDDAWVRDTGATFVTDGRETRGISWDFNAWGGLFSPWKNDSKIAPYMCDIQRMATYRTPGFVLEGGSIHVDGDGTCITTRECLLQPNRNPQFTEEDIDCVLRMYLGVQKVIWLDYGLADDETNGHVDNMACFARPGEILLAWTDDPMHPQYHRSKTAYDTLRSTTDAKGRRFTIHKIHIPDDMFMTQEEADGLVRCANSVSRTCGDKLAASYINFVMPNGGIVFPTFGDAVHDELARAQFETIFPDRKVVGFYSREFLLGGGNLHCLTAHQPLR